MMKWFIVVLMLGTYSDGGKDTYLYTNPNFDTVDQCKDYVYFSADEIRRHMMIEFMGNQIDMIYCVREDKLQKIIETPPGKST